jgi:hypothetical protein
MSKHFHAERIDQRDRFLFTTKEQERQSLINKYLFT